MDQTTQAAFDGVFDNVDAKALCRAYRFAAQALGMTYVVDQNDRERLATALLMTFVIEKLTGNPLRHDAEMLADASLARLHQDYVMTPKLRFRSDSR